jgi:hypothetical protein
LYGISQNPDTGDYILVFNWTSGNEKIDVFIQEKQLKICYSDDVILEWIPFNQFYGIKETCKDGFITVYSAIWKDGPLYYEYPKNKYIRDSNKKVALKCIFKSYESIDSLINEVRNFFKYLNTFLINILQSLLFIFRQKNIQQNLKHYKYCMEYLNIQIQEITFWFKIIP